jgi:hypothetical protein
MNYLTWLLISSPPETLPITETSPVKAEAVLENGLPNGHDSLPPTAEITVADGVPIKQSPTELVDGQGTITTSTQVSVDDRVSSEEANQQTKNETTTKIESTEQPGPSCTLSEPVESKQTKRPIPTEEVETSPSQPDSKRTKVEPSVAGTIPIVDAPKVGSTENRTDPQNIADSMPLDNPFKEEPHVFLKSDNEEIKRCMCVLLLLFLTSSLCLGPSIRVPDRRHNMS